MQKVRNKCIRKHQPDAAQDKVSFVRVRKLDMLYTSSKRGGGNIGREASDIMLNHSHIRSTRNRPRVAMGCVVKHMLDTKIVLKRKRRTFRDEGKNCLRHGHGGLT